MKRYRHIQLLPLLLLVLCLPLAIGCNSQKSTDATSDQKQRQNSRRQGPPSVDEIFKMDTNQDGKLERSELNGRLLQDFAKIDTNEDGFITREELENAPKPQRGQRPPNRN